MEVTIRGLIKKSEIKKGQEFKTPTLFKFVFYITFLSVFQKSIFELVRLLPF